MTISKTGVVATYSGDGATVAFPYPYRFLTDDSLVVTLLDAASAETLLVLGTDYTVVNNGDETGGTVTFAVPPAVGETIIISRETGLTQDVDYTPGDRFPAEVHEQAIDKLTMLAQEREAALVRTMRVPVGDTASLVIPSNRASKYLAFDSSKNPIAVAGDAGGYPVTPFMATVLDDPDAPTARATLAALGSIVEDTSPQLGGVLDANGHMITLSKGSDLVSAATLTLGNDGNYFDVTGGATISAISASSPGMRILLRFSSALTLVHGAALQLPESQNYIVAAGEVIEFLRDSETSWRMLDNAATHPVALWEGGTAPKSTAVSPVNVAAAVRARMQETAMLVIEQASGVGGGASVAGGTFDRVFNKVLSNGIPGLSLDTATGYITLPEGEYEIDARVLCSKVLITYAFIYSVTDAAMIADARSDNARASSGYDDVNMDVNLSARMSIPASGKVVVFRQYTGASNTTGLGTPMAIAGQVERYGFCKIKKVG